MLCIYTMTQTHLNNALKATDSIPYGIDAKPVVVGANFMNMEHYKNRSLENIEGEIWVLIPNYGDFYQISNYSRVKSIKRTKPKILKQSMDDKGYLWIGIYKNKKMYRYASHRLSSESFIPNPHNKPQVNHKDGIHHNNFIENLEWCTQSENNFHAYRVLNRKHARGMLGKKGVLCKNSKKIIQLDLNGNKLKEWDCMSDVQRELGFSSSNIGVCCRGIIKSSRGFKWKYA